MYPGEYAKSRPDHPAIIDARSGAVTTYAMLDRASNRVAQYLHAKGLRRGDCIAVLLENTPRYYEVAWAALRSGLYITPVNRYLLAKDVAYILEDCSARALFTSARFAEILHGIEGQAPDCAIRLAIGGAEAGLPDLDAALAGSPETPLADEPLGQMMLYSSGTTGRPKGIVRPLPDQHVSDGFSHGYSVRDFGIDADSVYLSPAPLYHAAPFAWSLGVTCNGGTVVLMDRFDEEWALQLIERYRVTCSQWVPTMFVRMLKLPEEIRAKYDLSSHRMAVHAAAPCPVEVKKQMIEWWGPIISEYYGGSEGNGRTVIHSADWLTHPGSVGRANMNIPHICDDDGRELPVGESGLIYFEQEGEPFRYHNDPDKTAKSRHPVHPNWTTLGDVGYLDTDGFLYLTDRKTFMIISGGVNIYPRIIEDALIVHPEVTDVAVIGVPNDEFGEEVKAIVQPADPAADRGALASELAAFAKANLAGYMVPRSFDFMDELPRLPTGKLNKNDLKAPYWQQSGKRI
ncbi:MAG: acyl-CoA synthetase [Minwuia sp.]|uniref:acyl-CoA synthetase n=1 Tax=Minwuia sp. TaxID=2493630 RepID=UPI003A8AE626